MRLFWVSDVLIFGPFSLKLDRLSLKNRSLVDTRRGQKWGFLGVSGGSNGPYSDKIDEILEFRRFCQKIAILTPPGTPENLNF
jgi:hypothetical protein